MLPHDCNISQTETLDTFDLFAPQGFENFFPKNKGSVGKTKKVNKGKGTTKDASKTSAESKKDSGAKKAVFGAFKNSKKGGGSNKKNDEPNQVAAAISMFLMLMAARSILEEDSVGNGREVSLIKAIHNSFEATLLIL